MDNIKNEILEKIRSARENRYLTNCYTLDVVKHNQRIWTKNDEFVFSYEDHGVNRLIFCAKEWESVDELLEIIKEGTYYLEFMTKSPEEYRPKESFLTAKMLRMSNPDCRSVLENSLVIQYKDSVPGEKARTTDAEEINKILWSTFHTEISHLLWDDEVRDRIDQFTIHRNKDGIIDALLQADVMPKKFYINQIVNKAEKNVIHAILLNQLEQYIEHGGKYLFAWVEEENIASLKFHEKYGMRHDGMYSMIYRIER